MKNRLFCLLFIVWSGINTSHSSVNSSLCVDDKAFQIYASQFQYGHTAAISSSLQSVENFSENNWTQPYKPSDLFIEQVTDQTIPEDLLMHFAKSQKFKSLYIKGGKLPQKFLENMGNSHYLQTISLMFVPLDPKDVAVLLESRYRCFYKSLTLNFNNLTADCLKSFKNKSLTGLEHLDLSDNPITNEGLGYLAGMPIFPSLRSLNLSSTSITSKGLTREVFENLFKPLINLNLTNTYLGNKGAFALVAFKFFPNLKSLHLQYTFIETAGAQALLKSPFLQKLDLLDLGNNPIGVLDKTYTLSFTTKRALPSLRK